MLVMAQIAAIGAGASTNGRPPDGRPFDSVNVVAVRDSLRDTDRVAAADSGLVLPPSDSLLGLSGKLRARFLVTARHTLELPVLRHFFGDSAVSEPGVYPLRDSAMGGRAFALITMLPFASKTRGRVGDYRIGWWPAEHHRLRSLAYANPDGFIRVTPDNQDTPVSEHFRLRDFLSHDQQDVWPKYIVLREALVDKLELIIDDLATHGHPDAHLVVLSGFRTPAYNALGVGPRGGRARDSRHQFGDAADIYVDSKGDGMIDDLNGDGRIDSRDARLLLASVDRVEAAHPELVGGAGVYRGTKAHGPFLHVDVRGEAVRWAVEEKRHRRAVTAHRPPAAPTEAVGRNEESHTPAAAPAD
jgi:hypothetical protein